MKSRLIVVGIRVHEKEENCYSSNDYLSYISFKDFKTFRNWMKVKPFKIRSFISDKNVFLIYLKSFTFNKNRASIEALIPKNPVLEILIKEFFDKKSYINAYERTKQGYVSTYSDLLKPEDHYGSFDKDFVESKKDYIEQKCCFGYYGHSSRKHWMDKDIMSIVKGLFNEKLTKEEVADWLSSTSARHWMDNIDPNDKGAFSKSFINICENVIKTDLKSKIKYDTEIEFRYE